MNFFLNIHTGALQRKNVDILKIFDINARINMRGHIEQLAALASLEPTPERTKRRRKTSYFHGKALIY